MKQDSTFSFREFCHVFEGVPRDLLGFVFSGLLKGKELELPQHKMDGFISTILQCSVDTSITENSIYKLMKD